MLARSGSLSDPANRGGPATRIWLLTGLLIPLLIVSQEPPPAGDEPGAKTEVRHARHVVIPLPIVGTGDLTAREMVLRALEQLPAEQPRPVLVLEFRGDSDDAGAASQFERCLSLARFLASDALNRVRTVAFVPGKVKGHAVLPVIACEELIVNPDAELGAAGMNEAFIDQTMRSGYEEIAARRRTLPTPLVLGMLDKSLAVYQVKTVEGSRFVLGDELARLEQEGAISVKQTIVPPDDLGLFTGRQLRMELRVASHYAQDLEELTSQLSLPPGSLTQGIGAGSWNAVLAELNGPINANNVSWLISSLEQQCAAGEVNFVCIQLDTAGGSPEDSIRLAQWLADQELRQIKTVAFVPRQARSDAALIPLGCDELVIGHAARLGGPGATVVSAMQLESLIPAIKLVTKRKQRDWSIVAGLIDPNLEVHRYTRAGGNAVRFLCQQQLDELPDPDQWQRGAAVQLDGGINGDQAVEYRLAAAQADSLDELQNRYGLQDRPRRVERNWAHALIERLASPGLARTLLFFAFFALMIELMNPGLSVSGFISGLCFLLFFWSQFLHGTAGWLEVLLFCGGVLCVLIEILVVPGVGVFGIGGSVLIIASIILASQTFVIPRNEYQLHQLPQSLSTILAAAAGMIVSIVVARRLLPHTPFLRNVMLAPPDPETAAAIESRERLANFDYLVGKRGITTTQLTPSGKARFGDDVINVISAGELIPKGTSVQVTETRGNHVIVARSDS